MTLDKIAQKVLEYLSSLKIAVLIILSLAIISAYGTIVESQYDAYTAQRLVFHSWYMYITLAMLIVTLTSVMVDRLPWKRRHIPFILAHIGIIILLMGSYVTQKIGVDGSVAISVGGSEDAIMLSGREVSVHTFDLQEGYKKVFNEDVEFFANPPEKNPINIPVGEKTIKILKHMRYAKRESSVSESQSKRLGSGLRFQLKNKIASHIDWMVQNSGDREDYSMGPLKIVLSRQKAPKKQVGPLIWLQTNGKTVLYSLFDAKTKKVKSGSVKKGDTLKLPWMNFTFQILNFYPHAKYKYKYKRLERPNELSTSAVLVEFDGEKKWCGLNSALELFDDESGYVFVYANKRIPMGFEMTLKEFNMGKYQGTQRAMSYESRVEIHGLGERLISMNEPLKYKNFTFYQSSFGRDAAGTPTDSIFSVNRDPGRFWKYLGSILIVVGSIWLFYFKKYGLKKK